MARDLKALFAVNDPRLAAPEVFTDRTAQWGAITGALAEHIGHVTGSGFDAMDLEAPRHNVLAVFGVGGIGKSSLSRRVEAALRAEEERPAQWPAFSWPSGRLVPIRIDLARAASPDFEQVILSLRLGLVQLGRPLPAFDLGLSHYWKHQHPTEPLGDYLRARSSAFARFNQAVNLPEQVQAALGEVAQALALPGAIGSVAGKVTTALVRALREHRTTVRALAGCERLADLLEIAEPDLEMLSYTPHLLSYDLAQLPEPVIPVVLLDTWEDTGDRAHRDLERLLQRIVWLMPGAFFVITGRNRLQWADAGLEGQLDWTGPIAWPGLVQQAPGPGHRAGQSARQILLGDLSEQDCEDYLARRLSVADQPLIPAQVRRTITERSHGLPLYLDLAVGRFLELRRTGHSPAPDDFDHDFPALVARAVSDLTAAEREVLRAVSLLAAWSVPLATRAAGQPTQAAANRLAERPFVLTNPAALWPNSLHQAVATAIRTTADPSDDRWSKADWRTAAARALVALGEELDQHGGERAWLIGCMRQALALAAEFELPLGWLADAAFRYTEDMVWEPLATPGRDDSETLASAADALAETLSALAARQHEHRSRTASRLQAVVDSGLLTGELVDLARYYLAKARRDLGERDASREGMTLVAEGGSRLAGAARRGLSHLARAAGDFPAAVALAQSLEQDGRHRVMGEVHWPQGLLDLARADFEAARTDAEQRQLAGEAALAQGMLAWTSAFADPAAADAQITRAQDLLQHVNLRAITLTTRIAALLRDAGHPGTGADRFEVHYNELAAEIEQAGVSALGNDLLLAKVFHYAVMDHPDVDQAVAELQQRTAGRDFAYLADIGAFMADLPSATDAQLVRWLDGEDTTRQRWRALVLVRRAHLQDR